MEEFGKYSFNKSHAAAYGAVSYTTAWLKFYYPTEFMAALMNNSIKKNAKIARYIAHATNDLGIKIASPSIVDGAEIFLPVVKNEEKRIIFALAAKDTSTEILADIAKERSRQPFISIESFLTRCYPIINKKTFKALACIGAFDEFNAVRSQLVAATDDLFDKIAKFKAAVKRNESSKRPRKLQFEEWVDTKAIIPNSLAEFPEQPRLCLEKEYLGVYLTGHPLNRYRSTAESWANFDLSNLAYDVDEETGDIIMASPVQNKQRVQVVAIISEFKQTVTKAKKELMGIATIEDLSGGATKLLIFPNLYAQVKSVIESDEVYKVTGTLKFSADEPPCICCEKIEPIQRTILERVNINVDSPKMAQEVIAYLEQLKCVGDSPVYLIYQGMKILLDKKYWVNPNYFKQYCEQNLLKAISFKTW